MNSTFMDHRYSCTFESQALVHALPSSAPFANDDAQVQDHSLAIMQFSKFYYFSLIVLAHRGSQNTSDKGTYRPCKVSEGTVPFTQSNTRLKQGTWRPDLSVQLRLEKSQFTSASVFKWATVPAVEFLPSFQELQASLVS